MVLKGGRKMKWNKWLVSWDQVAGYKLEITAYTDPTFSFLKAEVTMGQGYHQWV